LGGELKIYAVSADNLVALKLKHLGVIVWKSPSSTASFYTWRSFPALAVAPSASPYTLEADVTNNHPSSGPSHTGLAVYAVFYPTGVPDSMIVSTTAVRCTPTSIAAGSSAVVRCTAKVKGYSPTGTVTWSSTGTGAVSLPVGTTCTLAKGSCSVTFKGTSSGTVLIHAAYGGDPDNAGSIGARNLTVK
jgi:hypothetical protein